MRGRLPNANLCLTCPLKSSACDTSRAVTTTRSQSTVTTPSSCLWYASWLCCNAALKQSSSVPLPIFSKQAKKMRRAFFCELFQHLLFLQGQDGEADVVSG